MAEQRAAELGIGADRVLVSAGTLTEGDYLGALADFLGIGHEPLDELPRHACPPANHWLQRARERLSDQHGTFWDSKHLGPGTPGAKGEGPPAAQFLHGFNLGGTAAIVRANDPFWNIRAFDNALSKHDGYRLSSFICAMHQLVMDEITNSIQTMPNKIVPPLPAEPSPAEPN